MTVKKLPNWHVAPPNEVAIQDGGIDLWLIDLNPPHFNLDSLPISTFAQDERDRANRFRFDRHRRQYYVGRLGLRTLLSRYTGQSPEEITFTYGEFGKPSLENNIQNLEFNLSNSHEMALVAVTVRHKVGADLEFQERKLWDVDSLAKTVFTEQEISELNRYPAEDRLIPFLSGWTRKEAYLKAIGKGLALPLKQFSVELKNDVDNPKISASEWNLHSFWSKDDYLSAIAYPAALSNPTFRWFSLNDLI